MKIFLIIGLGYFYQSQPAGKYNPTLQLAFDLAKNLDTIVDKLFIPEQ